MQECFWLFWVLTVHPREGRGYKGIGIRAGCQLGRRMLPMLVPWVFGQQHLRAQQANRAKVYLWYWQACPSLQGSDGTCRNWVWRVCCFRWLGGCDLVSRKAQQRTMVRPSYWSPVFPCTGSSMPESSLRRSPTLAVSLVFHCYLGFISPASGNGLSEPPCEDS